MVTKGSHRIGSCGIQRWSGFGRGLLPYLLGRRQRADHGQDKLPNNVQPRPPIKKCPWEFLRASKEGGEQAQNLDFSNSMDNGRYRWSPEFG